MSLHVIGAGMGRTGTHSLKLALEKLGFGPCYHMVEVINNPQHVSFWHAAAEQEGDLDWLAVFSGYRAAVDWPSTRFVLHLANSVYSEARVILTERDPEKWYQSASQTIYPFAYRDLNAVDEQQKPFLRMVRKLIFEDTFHNRFEDADFAINIYQQHVKAVKRQIAPERLLTFSVADGWEPLCEFLRCEIPDEVFPYTNTTEDFNRPPAPVEA